MSNRPEDFTKEFFQKAWGADGYYEKFSYGLGFDKVIQICLLPFLTPEKVVLEIGCGGGTFTDYMVGKTKHTTAIDVIKQPVKFNSYPKFNYMEMPDRDYTCPGMAPDNFDFAFCYNVFCHLSNDALKDYVNNGIHKVMKVGADFVFMLANFKFTSQNFPNAHEFKREDNRLTPVGHFHQDERTVDDVIDPDYWEIVSRDMVPGHRDLVIHIRKKHIQAKPDKAVVPPPLPTPVRLPFISRSEETTAVRPVIDIKSIKNYSQNNEQEIILNYFGNRLGTLLDIGANDGVTLSNSRALMNIGWKGMLIEPSPQAFARLENVYIENDNAFCYEIAVGLETKMIEFWESGAFNHVGEDVGLLSCIDVKEKERWGETVNFKSIEVQMVTFHKLLRGVWCDFEDDVEFDKIKFNFINIDAEGMDFDILKQIDLHSIGCECFCIEHNGVPDMIEKCRQYAFTYGFREIGFNGENLIFAK